MKTETDTRSQVLGALIIMHKVVGMERLKVKKETGDPGVVTLL